MMGWTLDELDKKLDHIFGLDKIFKDDTEDDTEEPMKTIYLGKQDNGKCMNCNKSFKDDEDIYECDECGNDICAACIIQELENVSICKKCIDETYPREEKIVEKLVEKIVEVPAVETVKSSSTYKPIL